MRTYQDGDALALPGRERTPKGPFGVDQPYSTASDVPADHRPAAAADTVGPLRIEHGPALSGLAFSPRRRNPRGSPYRFADRHSRSVRTSVRSRGLRT